MLKRNSLRLKALLTTIAAAALIQGCGTQGNVNPVTPQGSIPLESLTVGLPEDTVKSAILTFVVDPNPTASVGGKTQYNSRTYDAQGGQYIVNCKDGKVFQVQVMYPTNPITKEQALVTMKKLLPATAPAQTRTKEGKKGQPKEMYFFGDYRCDLVFSDDTKSKVSVITAHDTTATKDGKAEKEAGEDKGKKTPEAKPTADEGSKPSTADEGKEEPGGKAEKSEG
ncbi:MAG TPA: hypothetical protein V6D17_09715 [Candidatus Obscuribacterales bacterium]